MKIVKTVKTVGGLVTSIGVGAVVTNVIKFTTPVGVGPVIKVCAYISGVILSGLVSDQATKYVEEKS